MLHMEVFEVALLIVIKGTYNFSETSHCEHPRDEHLIRTPYPGPILYHEKTTTI